MLNHARNNVNKWNLLLKLQQQHLFAPQDVQIQAAELEFRGGLCVRQNFSQLDSNHQ